MVRRRPDTDRGPRRGECPRNDRQHTSSPVGPEASEEIHHEPCSAVRGSVGGGCGRRRARREPSSAASGTPATSDASAPTVAPEGPGVIAFIREDPFPVDNHTNFHIRPYVIGSDGSDLHSLNPALQLDPRYLAWSPDGSRILVVIKADLYWVDVATGTSSLIGGGCHAPCSFDTDPSVSSDGSTVVFTRFLSTGNNDAPASVVATIDVTSGVTTQLDATFLPGAFAPCGTHGANCNAAANDSPAFSPDGRQIAFVRTDERVVIWDGNPKGFPTVHGDIVVMNADGTNQRTLDLGGLSARDPIWSPDGSRLVFSSYVEDYTVDENSGIQDMLRTRRDVYTIAVDGTDLRRLTDDGLSTAASWTPGGQVRFIRILVGPQESTPNYWRMNADGTGAEQITTIGKDVWGRSVPLEFPAVGWWPKP